MTGATSAALKRARSLESSPDAEAVTLRLPGGVSVSLPGEALDALVEALARRLPAAAQPLPGSPYLTIREAAEFLRCSRQRVDDLLSQRRLTRFKDGSRTLVSRTEIEEYVRDPISVTQSSIPSRGTSSSS
jgi:excisionase family DNA binding protein